MDTVDTEMGEEEPQEGWYSVTPEAIANHVAYRIAESVINERQKKQHKTMNTKTTILDAMAGCGGNTIHFANFFDKVIAVDLNADRLELAKNNVQVYGHGENVEFHAMNFLHINNKFKNIKIDAIFIAPPWGGPGYSSTEKFDLNSLTPSLKDMIQVAKNFTENIALSLPRNCDVKQLKEMIGGLAIEIEDNFLNGKLKTITVYLGNLINSSENIENFYDIDEAQDDEKQLVKNGKYYWRSLDYQPDE